MGGFVPDSALIAQDIADLSLAKIGTRYSSLRLICPHAYASMEESMMRHGQLSPIVVGRGDPFELVDGFKRLRACQRLGFTSLRARILEVSVHALKAAIIELNRKASSLCDMEEAMVVQSLYREDGLTQEEIAVLFGRHKSWVCRRISLIERLTEEVQEHIRLGLVRVGIGRELAKLPRGNQGSALRAVTEHRLTRRETEALVALLLARPRWEHDDILRFPREALESARKTETRVGDLASFNARFENALTAIENGCLAAAESVRLPEVSGLCPEERCRVISRLQAAADRLLHLRSVIWEDTYGAAVHPESGRT
jgi:ParB/RepB/Spo0J family partition protein